MRITIITGPFMCLPPDSIGAVEKLWNAVGNAWLQRGEEVRFICKDPKNGTNDSRRIYIKGYERTGSWLKDFLLDFVYSFKALCAVKDTEILILNSQWSPILIRLFARRYKKAIYSVERYPKNQMGSYKKIGKVDAFRCCSTAVYNALIEQNPELKSCSWIIPNFIDTTVFTGKERHLSKTPSIVYAGRIHREKGLDILVKAMDILNKDKKNGVHLTLIGAYDTRKGGSGEQYKNELNCLARNTEIEWIDPIYDAKQLANVIRKHDIFCYPSIAEKGEALSAAPLEAMGVGLPVVLSNLECFQDYISEGINGFLYDYKSVNAPELLADKISLILGSPELYSKLSIGALETSKKFSVDLIATQYTDKFEELLNG